MAVSNYVSTHAVEDAAAFTYPATNGTPYWAVTQWEISSTALPSPFNQSKAAVRFLMREDSEAGNNHILAQYAIYNTTGNLPSDGQCFFLSKLGSAITDLNRENSTRGAFFTTKNTAVRSIGTGTASMQIVKAKDGTSGWLVDQDGPYIVENLGSNIAAGETLQSTTFYIWNSKLGSDYTNSSIVSTYTTPIAPVGDKTYNKIVINGETLIDLSKDTVAASYMLASASGVSGSISAHDKNGQVIYGGIPTLSNGNLTRSGSIITAPAGYYATDASMAVSPGAWNIQYATTPYDVTLSATNLPITLSGSSIVVNMPNPVTASITATVTTSGYIDTGYQTGSIKVSGSNSVLATSIDSKLAAGNIKTGVTVFGVPGNYTYGASSPATSGEILTGKIAYVNGSKITGTMANWTTNNPTISLANEQIIISQGFHTGGVVSIDATSVSYLTPENIRAGSTILGVTGALTPSEEVVVASATAKGFVSLDPSASSQTFTPSGSVNFFNQVTIEPIIITSTVTSGTSGYTLTINASAPVFSASVQTSS